MLFQNHLFLNEFKFDPWKIPWRKAQQSTLVLFLENPKSKGAWQSAVHRVTQRQAQLR